MRYFDTQDKSGVQLLFHHWPYYKFQTKYHSKNYASRYLKRFVFETPSNIKILLFVVPFSRERFYELKVFRIFQVSPEFL